MLRIAFLMAWNSIQENKHILHNTYTHVAHPLKTINGKILISKSGISSNQQKY